MFSNLECQCIQYQIHFMFINNDGMQFYTIYHSLDNDNVCTRFTHLHYKLQISCPLLIKINCHTITLEPITKHLVAKDINKLHLSMDEWKIMHALSSLMDEWKNHATLSLSIDE